MIDFCGAAERNGAKAAFEGGAVCKADEHQKQVCFVFFYSKMTAAAMCLQTLFRECARVASHRRCHGAKNVSRGAAVRGDGVVY